MKMENVKVFNLTEIISLFNVTSFYGPQMKLIQDLMSNLHHDNKSLSNFKYKILANGDGCS